MGRSPLSAPSPESRALRGRGKDSFRRPCNTVQVPMGSLGKCGLVAAASVVMLVAWAGPARGQPTNMAFPAPYNNPDFASPFVTGMPRSGPRVSGRLSLSSTLAPGFPGGPVVALSPGAGSEDEGGPKEPNPIKGVDVDQGGENDSDADAEGKRERFPAPTRRTPAADPADIQVARRQRAIELATRGGSVPFPGLTVPMNTDPDAPTGESQPMPAPAPAPVPSSDDGNDTFDPNSLGAMPGEIPWIGRGQKVDYYTIDNDPGLIMQQWPGISTSDQPTVKYRPPDMALCVGEGVVLTAANLIIRAYNASTGDQLEGPIDFNSFMNLNINSSDVACIFDAQDTQRFFITVFGFGDDDPDNRFSMFAVAVSKTSRPIDGFWGPYIVRNDGLTPDNQTLAGLEVCSAWNSSYGPGCLGDYPVVGIDQHALWAGFNLFQTAPPPESIFAGPLVLGISKRDMMEGQYLNPAVVYISNFNLAVSFTVAPSWTMPGTPHDLRHNGTVFLFTTGPNTQLTPPLPAMVLWAVTNTASLDDPDYPLSGLPIVSDTVILDTLGYVDPASMEDLFNITQPAPGIPLDPSDARTTQVSKSGDYLWSTVQTVAYVGNNLEEPYMAAIYWGIFPFWDDNGTFNATTFSTGYVGVEGKHVGRPAITATADGKTAWMTGFITSPELPMSPFFVGIQAYDGPSTVHIPAVSENILSPTGRPDRPLNPDDPNGPGYLRAGDYSAAVLDEEGNVWLATEWSGGQPTPFCEAENGKGRCPNWSTYIMAIPKSRTALPQTSFPTA